MLYTRPTDAIPMDVLAVLVTSYPKGDDPCFTETGKKGPSQNSTAQFQFDHVLSNDLLRSYAFTYPIPA